MESKLEDGTTTTTKIKSW